MKQLKQILLITLGLSTLMWADFTKSGDIVSDSQTGLQWQDNAISSTMTWEAAIEYCENLSLGGHGDWRLPNLNELTSLVDDTKRDPSIHAAFQNVASDYYWSSTTYARDTLNAWLVDFNDGHQYMFWRKDGSYYVRCVRAGQ